LHQTGYILRTMNHKITRLGMLAAIIGLTGILVSGCSWSIGGGKKEDSVQQTTKGQELIDLKKARDQGALTEDEYQAQRNKVLAK